MTTSDRARAILPWVLPWVLACGVACSVGARVDTRQKGTPEDAVWRCSVVAQRYIHDDGHEYINATMRRDCLQFDASYKDLPAEMPR